jgi:two-component system, chemotaxis family, chemotaxis protein CheY
MKTCLIVDDSRVVRKVARKIFEDLGFTCSEAEDGSKAYEACMSAMPETILLDWNMPVMTGIEFLVKLRATAGGEVPKVIFCTTENELSFIQQAISAGANEYIMKPFDSEIVKGKLEQIGVL